MNNQFAYLLIAELKSSLYILSNSPLQGMSFACFFSLICDLTSHSLDYVVQSNLFEIFNGLKFTHSFFHESCLWCFILKVITILKVI